MQRKTLAAHLQVAYPISVKEKEPSQIILKMKNLH